LRVWKTGSDLSAAAVTPLMTGKWTTIADVQVCSANTSGMTNLDGYFLNSTTHTSDPNQPVEL